MISFPGNTRETCSGWLGQVRRGALFGFIEGWLCAHSVSLSLCCISKVTCMEFQSAGMDTQGTGQNGVKTFAGWNSWVLPLTRDGR